MLIVTIWPIFALICLGFALARSGFPSEGFWPAAERLNYFVLFPALLVSSLAEAPLGDPALLRLGGASIATICLAAALCSLAARLRSAPAARTGATLQGVVRFNTYLGLAITAALLGEEGLQRAAVYLAVAVPLVNILSIVALTGREGRRGPLAMLRLMLRNPLILACIAGILVSLAGTGLPGGTGRLLSLIGQASLPLGLLCVGAALKPRLLGRDLGAVSGGVAARLLAMPLLAHLVGRALGLGATEALLLVIFSAIPTAPTAYVLTRQLGGDGDYMAALITTQTLVSAATIPAVLWALG